MAKQFHISDILSVTDGRLVSARHIEGVYDILNYMTGDNLFTHQLPRAANECKPWLLRQHPQLNDFDGSTLDMALNGAALTEARQNTELAQEHWNRAASLYHASGHSDDAKAVMHQCQETLRVARKNENAIINTAIALWLEANVYPVYGEYLEVEPIPADDHAVRDPVAELVDMAGEDKVIVVKADDPA